MEPIPQQGFEKIKSLHDSIRRVLRNPEDVHMLEGHVHSILFELNEMVHSGGFTVHSESIQRTIRDLQYALNNDIRQAVNQAGSKDSAKFMAFLKKAVDEVSLALLGLPLN